MSVSSRHVRTLSPPLSTNGHFNAFTTGNQRLNVVTRLAVEGKSKKGWDGASIKVYLKISLPGESITPGATIALFPEENLKILDSQVHPLDNNSVPYNFSSTTCPLIHKAARALNLPARSPHSYVSVVDSASSSSGAPLEDKYTGHVLVSGYHVSYILPKEFPRRESDSRTRRGTIVAQFMAAIDIWVPFLTRPPFAPFLLSIPVPRCLSNHIKLSIFSPGPASMASSMASLSSVEEDMGPLELASEPHVTRSQSARISRSQSYTHFADDESSDASSSAGFAEGCGIQGTFPSTDRIRVRWAAPAKAGQVPETEDGRRRVGIKDVKGDMTCEMVGKGKGGDRGVEGLLMKLEYNATCKGVWFPGVATLVGMDVGLEAGDCDVSWALGTDPKWTVTGGPGFTGFAVGGPTQTPSPPPSMVRPPIYVLPSSPDGGALHGTSSPPSRQNSAASTTSTSSASLLRAPLPNQNTGDYSFESSPVSTPTGTISSLPSVGLPSSPERQRRSRASSVNGPYTDTDTDFEPDVRPPDAPITVHVNMNELLPPSKAPFTFRISGTVLVTPRHPLITPERRKSPPNKSKHPSSDDVVVGPTVVPMFHLFYKDREKTSTIVRNGADGADLEVLAAAGDLRDGKTLKMTLKEGDHVACGADGAHVALRTFPLSASPVPSGSRELSMESEDTPQTRTRKPNGTRSYLAASSTRYASMMSSTKPRRDGPLMIPSVTATVTPLLSEGTAFHNGYAVQISLPAPSDTDSEWLEFGLARPTADPSSSSNSDATTSNGFSPPRVDIASASVEGVPVRFQTSAVSKPNGSLGLSLAFEETSAKEWITWVGVHVGQAGGGKVEVIYLVKGLKEQIAQGDKSQPTKGKQKADNAIPFDILLPSFALPVGRLEVNVQVQAGYEVSAMRTNLIHQQSNSPALRLLQFSLDEFYYPRLYMAIAPQQTSRKLSMPSPTFRRLGILLACLLPIALISYLLMDLRLKTAELHEMRASLTNRSPEFTADYPHNEPETITVTTTILTEKWWFSASTGTLPLDSSTPPFSTSQARTQSPSQYPSQLSTDTLMPTMTGIPVLTPSTSASSVSHGESHSLLSLSDESFAWTLRFELPVLKLPEVPETARAPMDALINGLGAVWHIFRKVLHYPLDPP
ncbi:hypothetical protein BKA93DRAFT_919584 [Sparassis latifolia]